MYKGYILFIQKALGLLLNSSVTLCILFALLFNIFLSLSVLLPDTYSYLQNSGYWKILNSIIGIGGLLAILGIDRLFKDYQMYKEEAQYLKQTIKGIKDRNTKELQDIRKESLSSYIVEKITQREK